MSSCCLLFVVVGDLEQTGVGIDAGHCLLLAMCCGLEMVASGSNGSGPVLFIADNGLGMYCFYGDERFEMIELAVGMAL